MSKHFTALLLALASFASARAQGIITGTVLDDLGDPAYGATVVVEGSDPIIGTTTDLDGKYRLEVDTGEDLVSVTFSYVGLGDKTVSDVTLEDGEVTFLDVALEESSFELETATVTARALQSSDVALTKIRAGSDKILDGISSQEMSRLNLSDAAGAMTKVTGTTVVDGKFIVVRGLGDRYSTAQLNGLEMPSTDPYRNSPQLDLIPSSLLDNIITSKTFTPDQPGSFTGGNVNLQTKAFPDQRTFSVSVSAGYNTQATFNDDFLVQAETGANDYFGYDDGTRALPARLTEISNGGVRTVDQFGRERFVNPLSLGIQSLSVTDERYTDVFAQVEEAADLLPTDFGVRQEAPVPNHSIGLTYGDRVDLGGGRQLGYLLSAKFDRDYAHYAGGREALYDLADPNATALNPAFDYDDTRSVENPSVGLFGTTSLRLADGHTLTALGVYSHNTQITTRRLIGTAPVYNIDAPDVVDNTVLDFLERETITGQLSGEHALTRAGDFRLEWSGGITQSSQNTPNLRFLSIVRPGGVGGNSAVFRQNELGLPSNFFRELSDLQGEVKLDLYKDFEGGHKLQAGGSYREKTRDFSESIYESFYVGFNSNFPISGGVDSFFADSNTGVVVDEDGRRSVNNFVNDITAVQNSYDGTEVIAAAYLMGTLKVTDQLRVIGGARVEQTDLFVQSRDTSQAPGEIVQTNLLPSVNVIFGPNEQSNVRASFSQTLARPNMREIALFPSFEFAGGPQFQGNPDLKLTSIDNYDLRYEYFPAAGGILSASAFYKRFRDPIVQTFLTGRQGPFFRYVNVDQADVYGVELEARHDLGFVGPVWLENFTIGANYSLIQSEAAIDPEEVERNNLPDDTRPLQGQSPYIVNANLTYADRELGLDAGVSFNYFGDRLAFIGNRGTPDVFERGRGSLDASIGKTLGDFNVRLAASNLLNPAYETYADFKGTDFIFSRYQRGQTFKLSLGYTFKG